MPLTCAALSPAAAPSTTKAVFADIDGMVHPITAEIVASAIDTAKRDGASVLVLRLNTPGGLMDAMRDTIQLILASPVPVVTYVAPSGGRAASAGFFILEAGDVAAMAPGTNTGRRASGSRGRRDGRCDEGESGERRRRVHAQHLRSSAGATPRWPKPRFGKASRSPKPKRSTSI